MQGGLGWGRNACFARDFGVRPGCVPFHMLEAKRARCVILPGLVAAMLYGFDAALCC